MSKNKAFLMMIVVILALVIAGCGAPEVEEVTPVSDGADPVADSNAPSETAISGVTIFYHIDAQFELTDSEGNRVLMDVRSPGSLTSAATSSDILLTTNTRYRTFSQEFVDSFPGKQLFVEAGEINTPGVKITGIASGYTQYEVVPDASNNFIYIIEMGDLRIANLGQIGQTAFSQEQLAALGDIDVVLTHFVNSSSGVNVQNQIVFNLMDQLNPRLIIPTFGSGSMNAIELANEKWRVFTTTNQNVSISASRLANETQFLIMGDIAEDMAVLFELPEWEN